MQMHSSTRWIPALAKALSRPQLDFEFLLNEANLCAIRENIRSRKGVGNIDQLHHRWKLIGSYVGTDEHEHQQLWDELYEEAMLIPNMSDPDAPRGAEADARMVREFGSIKKMSSKLLTAERMMNNWRAFYNPLIACGQKSYAFIGPVADLEQSLVKFASKIVRSNGFHSVLVSDIVDEDITEGCGVQQRSEKDILYRILGNDKYCLSGTSETGLAASLRNRIFKEEELPLKLTAVSRCYRPEVASSANESKLYRVHEFNKVEMFVICTKDDSSIILQQLVDIQCNIFTELGLYCRLLDMPTEELGASAARKFDIEAWMPGRKCFGEVSSASNCTDYQSRRLDIKYVDSNGEEHFVHTCNATAIATTRALIALMESYQNEKNGLSELPIALKNAMPERRSSVIKMRDASNVNK